MAGIIFLVKFYIYWKIMCLGLHSAAGQVELRANSNHITPYQPITLNCSFSKQPQNGQVSFFMGNVLRAILKYKAIQNKCLIEHYAENGQTLGGGQCTDECDCNEKSYISSYNGTVSQDRITFECSGFIDSNRVNASIVVFKTKKPSGIWTDTNTDIIHVNETEGTISITCNATCVPGCEYSWTMPSGVENSNVLSIINVKRNHTGNYTCTAWNDFGNINTVIQIFVQYRPSIKIIPSQIPYMIQENDKDVTISCIINDAFPRDDILYRFTLPNGSVIESQNYTISSVEKIHSGIYICKATNAAGTSDGASLTVDVLYGPEIAVFDNINITEQRHFRQICNVTANPNATRVWWTRTKETGVFSEGNILNISNITRLFSDNFTCHAQNHIVPSTGAPNNITNNKSFSLNVQYGPEISKIKDVNVTEFSNFTTTCYVTANPKPLHIWWSRSTKDGVEQDGSVLNLQNIAKQRADDYICHAENMLHPTYPILGENLTKETSSSFYINVQYGPLVRNIGNVSVIENEPFNVSCNVTSNPLPHRVWWTRSKTSDVINGTVLIFTKTRRQNADFFTCHAENELHPSDNNVEVKKANNTPFYMNVQYGPGSSIQTIPSLLTLNVTENVDIINITCEADCNPPCSYAWTKNLLPISASGFLLDEDILRSDAGNYTCSARTTISTNISITSVEINVLYAAKISDISPNTTMNESLGFILECEVDSFPLSTITWTLNRTNKEVFKESGVRISKYSAEKANCNQTGIYACSAYSGISPMDVKYTELRILCSPRNNRKYLSSTSPIGIGDDEPLNITVYFISYPKPKALRWIFYKNNSSDFIEKTSNCNSYGIFEHKACFFKSNLTEADFGIYKLQVKYTDFETWEEYFMVQGNRRPDHPRLLNASCRIEEVYIHWKSGFNGGEKQTFFIQIVSDKSSRLMASKGIDNDHEITLEEGIILPSGEYSFAIFANNSYGNVTSDKKNCTISARKLPISSPPSVISAVAGSVAGIIVICALAAAVFFFVRKRLSMDKRTKKDMLQRSCLHNIDDEEDGLKDNPMYVSSEPHGSKIKSSGDVYSVVNKKKESSVDSQPDTDTAVYSQVIRKTIKGKENAVKKGKRVKDRLIEMDSVYENSNNMKERQTNDVYANTTGNKMQQNGNLARKNKDGLIYADLDLASGPSGSKFVIRGLENRNNYAIIDLTKTAEPLPSDSDSEEVNEQGSESKSKCEKE